MRKSILLIFMLIIACSTNTLEESNSENVQSSIDVITNTSFEYINTSEDIETEDFTDKKTIILFWADYWGICRRELPVVENELAMLFDEYDVIALAHSEYETTMNWVNENLNGELRIGFSTPELRDYFKVVGQPITVVLDTNGDIISRTFGELDLTNF